MTWSICLGSTLDFSSAPLAAMTPRSVAEVSRSAPPYVPKAVRAPSMMTMSFMDAPEATLTPLASIVPLRFGWRSHRRARSAVGGDVLRRRSGARLLRLGRQRPDIVHCASEWIRAARGAVGGRGGNCLARTSQRACAAEKRRRIDERGE